MRAHALSQITHLQQHMVGSQNARRVVEIGKDDQPGFGGQNAQNLGWIERVISPFTVHIGFKSDLDLPAFVAQAELEPLSIEKVNIPRIWSLVTCVKD